jgi:hypothetical protein
VADLVIVSMMAGFVALCVGYISWCDRIVRKDEAPVAAAPTEDRVSS